jgi:CRISPR-associated endonuclease/helicase Cas3
MRVLANQFFDGFSNTSQKFGIESTVQTGERPEDRRFLKNAIFTTIDQTLSNFLGVPYALSRRMANMNAGAVISSYLVFDEFHLFPPGGALKTTLQMLRLLAGVTPFLLMTATFSSAMLDQLKTLLNAEVITVSPEELQRIPSQQGKMRRFHAVNAELEAETVRENHKIQDGEFKRTLAVCNTVDRAQKLYLDLCKDFDEKEIILLHSRFTREHRADKEQTIRNEFGPDRTKRQRRSLILVATQVIEVGLDITCRELHTEVAPANAILQRAGRCARYKDEAGDVYIYQTPFDNENKRRNYAPYHQDGQDKLCEATWQAFNKPDRNGHVLDFHDEQRIIDEVHRHSDMQMLEAVVSQQAKTQDLIERAIGLGDSSVRRDLIRQMDSWTILVHDNPESLVNPLACQGFSMFHGSVRSNFKKCMRLAPPNQHQ